MSDVTWDLLLPTIPHRHELMVPLLEEINRQAQPGFGMQVYRDNLDRPGLASYGKWQDLMELSNADYISFIADDDWIAPNYVSRIMEALQSRPDYVGFKVRYTRNGCQMNPVEHSLQHPGWNQLGDCNGLNGLLYRDIVHHNPIKRELALMAKWRTDVQAGDYYWAEDLRNTGLVKNEVWIPAQMYYYQETSKSWTHWGAGGPQPMPDRFIPKMPEYPWLTFHGS